MNSKKTNDAPLLTAEDVANSFEYKGPSYSKSSKITLARPSCFYLSSRPGNFAKSTRGDLFSIPKTPGPGQYESSPVTSGPRYSLVGKSKDSQSKSPGPGTYSPNFLFRRSQGGIIGKDNRSELTQPNKSPGPGRYEVSSRPDTPSWTFQKTQDFHYVSTTPGPGNYESKSVSKSIGFKYPLARRKELFESFQTPGPGAYESKPNFSSFKYSIGKSVRMPSTKELNKSESFCVKDDRKIKLNEKRRKSKAKII